MDNISAAASALSAIVAVLAALFALQNARGAVRSADISERALSQANVTNLFSSFSVANQATVQYPELLHSVHGLDESVPLSEARNIAHLGSLLDAFQIFYGEHHGGDFSKMASEMKAESTFLNRILGVPQNHDRWQIIQSIHYGDFDRQFTDAITEIISFEHARRAPL